MLCLLLFALFELGSFRVMCSKLLSPQRLTFEYTMILHREIQGRSHLERVLFCLVFLGSHLCL